jgi:hypothetical protein
MPDSRAMRAWLKGPSGLFASVIATVALVWAMACQSGGQPTSPAQSNSPSAPPSVSIQAPVSDRPSATETPTAPATTLPTSPPSSPNEEALKPTTGDGDAVESIRETAFLYWEVFNSYEAEQVLAFLEPGYRATEEDLIRRDIGLMKLFGVKLGVSEESAPALMESGEWEMYLRMDTPTGTKRIRMNFAPNGDGWWITFSDEVD